MNAMPTHAFSSANQVANTYASNPQALQQRTNPPPNSGVKPELIDLIALQKIQAQQKVIANQMAMQTGMNQPTVAESLKQQVIDTEKKSLVDEASKNAGLPALMSQATAGTAPPPQQPPQQVVQAAEGGLMRIPTNLPDHYAQGGIIAFAGDDEDVGSYVPDYSEEKRPPMPYSEQMSNLSAFPVELLKNIVSAPGYGLNKPSEKRQEQKATTEKEKKEEESFNLGGDIQEQVKAIAKLRIAAEAGDAEAKHAYEMYAKKYPDVAQLSKEWYKQGTEPTLPAEKTGIAGIPTRDTQVPQAAPASEFESDTTNYISKRFKQDPDAIRAAEREEYLKAADPSYKLAMEQQKAGLARLQQLQEQARQNRPNDWMAMLNRIGSNGGYANAGLAGVLTGVGEAPARARAAAIQQDMEYETQVQALQKQMTDAMAAHDMGAYKQAFEAKKELENSQEKLTTPAASIINSKTQAEANRIRNRELDMGHAATLEETKRKNFLAALNVVNDNYKDIIEDEKQLALFTQDSSLRRSLEAKVNARKAERDRELKSVYRQYQMPIESSQPSSTPATVLKYDSSGKRIG